MKYITAFGIAALVVFAWISTIGNILSGGSHYEEYKREAEEYEERGLYTKAISSYFKAHEEAEVGQKYDIELKIIDCYAQLKDDDSYEKYCIQAIKKFPERQECYQNLISYYQKSSSFVNLVPLLEKAMMQFPEEGQYKEAYAALEKNYSITSLGYEELSDWYDGYLLAKTKTVKPTDEEETLNQAKDKNSKELAQTEYRILDTSGSTQVEGLYYDKLEFTDEILSRFLVEGKDNRWKIVNDCEYELENNLDAAFSEIGPLRQGYAWTVINGKYHLINGTMNVSKMTVDEIGTFQDGYTAVKQGDHWALFGLEAYKESTGYDYTDIKKDEFERCYINQMFFGKKNTAYQLYNEKGKAVSEEAFDDAKPFISSQPAAVEQNGKWGFVNKKGEIYIEPQYEDAKSFSNGYAAVKVNGKWGYINKENEIVIEPQFTDAKSFGDGGAAPVQGEDGFWNLIWMYTVKYGGGR